MEISVLWLFLSIAAIGVLVFFLVYRSSLGTTGGGGMTNPTTKRLYFIVALFIVLAISASIAIPKSPYYLFADSEPAKVLHVASRQFNFMLSETAIDPADPQGMDNVELPKNEVVEFRVTSLDVNHGFAIYNPSNRLVAQTQAMPGYVNILRWKFREPGEYKVLCLEYCGMSHHGMSTSFTVK